MIAHPIHHDAARVLKSLGGDASNFNARQLAQRITSEADLVLTMTKAHRDTVLQLAPRLLHRTFTLSEGARLASDARTVADLAALRPHLDANELPDIPDPIGKSAQVFAVVGSQIADLLPPILELCRRSAAPAGETAGRELPQRRQAQDGVHRDWAGGDRGAARHQQHFRSGDRP